MHKSVYEVHDLQNNLVLIQCQACKVVSLVAVGVLRKQDQRVLRKYLAPCQQGE